MIHATRDHLAMHHNKSFFEKLLDFSFSSFIAPQIVGVLYGVGLLAGALSALGYVLGNFSIGFARGLFSMIVAAVGLLVYTIILRVSLESFIALIRTADSTRILAENVLNNRPDINP